LLTSGGKPPSTGYTAGFHARAKLRLLKAQYDSTTEAWLFIERIYGHKTDLVSNLLQLADWWQKYCQKNGLQAKEILKFENNRWSGKQLIFPTNGGGGKGVVTIATNIKVGWTVKTIYRRVNLPV
jgi:hypothetical protein